MGHYDDCYEYDAVTEEDNEIKRLRKGLRKLMKGMDIDQLRFIDDISRDVESYRIFFRILNDNDLI